MRQGPLRLVLLIACCVLPCATARATCPDSSSSFLTHEWVPPGVNPVSEGADPWFIDVVGHSVPGVPDARGTFIITIKGAPGACADLPVEVRFCSCFDLELDADQPSVDCATRTIAGVTNAFGRAAFTIEGAGQNAAAPAPGPGMGCVEIWAGSPLILMKHATAVVYDQNGDLTVPGVDLTDFVSVLKDWGSGFYVGRTDFDHDGSLGLSDIVGELRILGDASSRFGMGYRCASPCP